MCCFYLFGQKLFLLVKNLFFLLLLIVISTICLFSVENIYFGSKTPQRVRGEYSRVRAYPGKAVFAQKTVQGEWIALFMQHLSASTRRVRASKGLTPKKCVVCFVLFCCSACFCKLVLLIRCVIGLFADHLYTFSGISGQPPGNIDRGSTGDPGSRVTPLETLNPPTTWGH